MRSLKTGLRLLAGVAALPLLFGPAQAAAQARNVEMSVEWRHADARPFEIRFKGENGADRIKSTSVTAQGAETIVARSAGGGQDRRLVLRLYYGNDYAILAPVRLAPGQKTANLVLGSRQRICTLDVSEELRRDMNRNRNRHIELLDAIISALRSYDTECRNEGPAERASFAETILTGVRYYARLPGGALNITHFAEELISDPVQRASLASQFRTSEALQAVAFVNALYTAGDTDEELLRAATGELVLLADTGDLSDAFAQLDWGRSTYEGHLLNFEFTDTVRFIENAALDDDAIFAEAQARVQRFANIAEAPEGSREAMAFANSSLDPALLTSLEQRTLDLRDYFERRQTEGSQSSGPSIEPNAPDAPGVTDSPTILLQDQPAGEGELSDSILQASPVDLGSGNFETGSSTIVSPSLQDALNAGAFDNLSQIAAEAAMADGPL